MKHLLVSIILFISFLSFEQTIQWKKISEFKTLSNIWNIDEQGNRYFAKNDIIEKFDSTGNLLFSQSIKSIGTISNISILNALKIVLFSEEQQLVCFLDNTLTLLEDCIDLNEKDISLAKITAASSQPDKTWVIDNYNLTLHLLDLSLSQQEQKTINLQGVLQLSKVNQLIERENQLFLLSPNGIYHFDLYGSLLHFFEVKEIVDFDVVGKSLYYIKDNHLFLQSLEYPEKLKLNLPDEMKNISSFKIIGGIFYFQTQG